MNVITYDERKLTYQTAWQKWGEEAQVMMAVEEMSELTKEICKIYRGQGSIDNIAEEIADVTIMMEQLRLIYDINDAVCEQMDLKIKRLQNKLGE